MMKSLDKAVAVRLDDKGRLTIPSAVRKQLGMGAGDTYFIQAEGEVIHLMKGENPFDALAKQAIDEFESGETKSLRDIMNTWKEDE